MTPTTIREAIDWIGACPLLGPNQERMTRILTKNEREFDNGRFQFTVSMHMQLNVIVDDGFHGCRGPEELDRKWFTLGPHDDGLILRLGDGSEIKNEAVMPEQAATELIRQGIRHINNPGLHDAGS